MTLLEEMHKRELVECSEGPFLPLVAAKDNVAIEPSDLIAGARHPIDSSVKESLLLPHDMATTDLHEYVSILSCEFEAAVEGEFHCYQRDREVFTE